MEIKMEAKAVEKLDVTLNGVHVGEFVLSERWEGFIKLTNEKGVIIAMTNKSFFDELFVNMFLGDKDIEYTILKISPGLIPIPDKEAVD